MNDTFWRIARAAICAASLAAGALLAHELGDGVTTVGASSPATASAGDYVPAQASNGTNESGDGIPGEGVVHAVSQGLTELKDAFAWQYGGQQHRKPDPAQWVPT